MSAPTNLASVLAAVEARVSYLRSSTTAPPEDGWIRSSDLLSGGPSLVELISETGEGRGTHDRQVAASLFVQGYAFRVGGVALAAFALGLDRPSTDPAHQAIKIARHRPSAVAHLDGTLHSPDPERLAIELLRDHLAPFIDAVRREVRVGERLLWGNVAASCAVALRAVEGESTSADERATIRARGDQFMAAARSWLDGVGQFVVVAGQPRDGWFWERSNCCLWYQASGGSMCDDCSLLDPDERLAGWQRQLEGAGA